jgi:hypothetical protein
MIENLQTSIPGVFWRANLVSISHLTKRVLGYRKINSVGNAQIGLNVGTRLMRNTETMCLPMVSKKVLSPLCFGWVYSKSTVYAIARIAKGFRNQEVWIPVLAWVLAYLLEQSDLIRYLIPEALKMIRYRILKVLVMLGHLN